MNYDKQYWRGFIGGLNWIVRTFNIEWGLFHEINKKVREVKKEKLTKNQ